LTSAQVDASRRALAVRAVEGLDAASGCAL
jgi:hypothetical protein